MIVGFRNRFSYLLSLTASLIFLIGASLSAAYSAEIPSDDEQDILIRTTLMTFNDANMTGNYAVLVAKASKEFQSQISAEKLFTSFESFRTNRLFFESVATDDYDSYENAKFDPGGALVLAGVFKNDGMKVKYRLRFTQSDNAWKLLGIDVDATKL
jgi:hypothetical protein